MGPCAQSCPSGKASDCPTESATTTMVTLYGTCGCGATGPGGGKASGSAGAAVGIIVALDSLLTGTGVSLHTKGGGDGGPSGLAGSADGGGAGKESGLYERISGTTCSYSLAKGCTPSGAGTQVLPASAGGDGGGAGLGGKGSAGVGGPSFGIVTVHNDSVSDSFVATYAIGPGGVGGDGVMAASANEMDF